MKYTLMTITLDDNLISKGFVVFIAVLLFLISGLTLLDKAMGADVGWMLIDDLKVIGACIAVFLFFIFGMVSLKKLMIWDLSKYQRIIDSFADKPYQEISATYEGCFLYTSHGKTSATSYCLWFKDEKGRLMYCECPSSLYLSLNTPDHEKGEKITLRYYPDAYKSFWDDEIYQFGFEDYILWNAKVVKTETDSDASSNLITDNTGNTPEKE